MELLPDEVLLDILRTLSGSGVRAGKTCSNLHRLWQLVVKRLDLGRAAPVTPQDIIFISHKYPALEELCITDSNPTQSLSGPYIIAELARSLRNLVSIEYRRQYWHIRLLTTKVAHLSPAVLCSIYSNTDLCSRLRTLKLIDIDAIFTSSELLMLTTLTALTNLEISMLRVDVDTRAPSWTQIKQHISASGIGRLERLVINSSVPMGSALLSVIPGSLQHLTSIAINHSDERRTGYWHAELGSLSHLVDLQDFSTSYAISAASSDQRQLLSGFAHITRLSIHRIMDDAPLVLPPGTALAALQELEAPGCTVATSTLLGLPKLRSVRAGALLLAAQLADPERAERAAEVQEQLQEIEAQDLQNSWLAELQREAELLKDLERQEEEQLQQQAQWNAAGELQNCLVEVLDLSSSSGDMALSLRDLPKLPLLKTLVCEVTSPDQDGTDELMGAVKRVLQMHATTLRQIELVMWLPALLWLPASLPQCYKLSMAADNSLTLQMLAACELPKLEILQLFLIPDVLGSFTPQAFEWAKNLPRLRCMRLVVTAHGMALRPLKYGVRQLLGANVQVDVVWIPMEQLS